MKAYITFTRRGLVALFAVAVVVFLICSEVYSAGNNEFNAQTNADRITFIKNAGYEILLNNPESKTVVIPEVFSDVYNNYNDLQQISGYDLSAYKGCEVIIYTYSIKAPKGYSGDSVFNMIVYNNRVIGGDVSSRELGGFMLPISRN